MRKVLIAGLFFLSWPGICAERFTASFQTTYQGSHQDLFASEQDRVRLLVKQAQLEASSQLGLIQYQEGFLCPLTVRFDDKPAAQAENALAYVELLQTGHGMEQELVVNLDVMANYTGDFDPIFYHEMTHAVLNDAVVVPTHHLLPSWVQEGLAVYIAGNGDTIVRQLAQNVRKSQAGALVRDLDLPVRDYPRDYLAFKYILQKHGINSLQAFVRDLVQGQSPTEAIADSTGLAWDVFKKNLSAYSLQIYAENARPDY
jgi:hypothetical protein